MIYGTSDIQIFSQNCKATAIRKNFKYHKQCIILFDYSFIVGLRKFRMRVNLHCNVNSKLTINLPAFDQSQ